MEIKFYESADGQVPVRDFLDGVVFLHAWKSSGFDAWFHQENAENTGS